MAGLLNTDSQIFRRVRESSRTDQTAIYKGKTIIAFMNRYTGYQLEYSE